ncbi:hypothetical protein O181_021029 [Austropuccinia psidii MF-1]|uniref:Reverse transcriptase RNase H-like domain-containing protein n=1 Tax=Austropuccinia psidii MF-1 TaxID=1389203 RepID=A0A9Q3GWA0_9BASI|nr:hypothetical protein [Austropuccinia psidii MF-1]
MIPLFILDSNESPALFITHYTNDIKSSSNDLATSVNSVALVGEPKTPSLTPSVHIPSIIPSQSLLPLRDERCWRICFYIFTSSLSRGYRLSPSSFHASLEKQWDEEEEPEEMETVVKVVPHSYYQYLDVLSKMKAEKPPPHFPCDHHIKLEGRLPPEDLSQFQILKEAFNTAPILSHFSASLSTIVETNASDYALGAVLSQLNESGKHPIAFDSCKLPPAEMNYEIHDKELLGIVWALKCWRDFLLCLSNPFEVLTDHSFLQYFMSSKVLTCRLARWVEFLSESHFTITYHCHIDARNHQQALELSTQGHVGTGGPPPPP